MLPLRFSCQDAKGESREWTLIRLFENTRCIQGRTATDSLLRIFRKDRIQASLEGHDQLQFDRALPAPALAPQAQPDTRSQILFTSFKVADRLRLEAMVAESGFRVMKTVSKALAALCIGYNASPAKVEDAREAGAFVMNDVDLMHLIRTGEIVC